MKSKKYFEQFFAVVATLKERASASAQLKDYVILSRCNRYRSKVMELVSLYINN